MEPIILSISDLNQLLNHGLLEMFPKLEFQGEISELTHAASGHMYLTLKDDNASMSCTIWKNSFFGKSYKPVKGDLVKCLGKPSVYVRNGRLQMIIDIIEPLGAGTLEEQFKQLKIKLEKEGLFDLSRKREIPRFPTKIGIVTSAKGAALQDILVRIKARNPGLDIDIFDSLVQGESAVDQILDGIKYFNLHPVDFIIIARGGGSLSDLWCFNSEILVRGIFSSKIPIVSAVGHEVDITLADLVADFRAPTPTAAAEILIPSVLEISERLKIAEKKLLTIVQKLDGLLQDLDFLTKQFDQNLLKYFELKKLKLAEVSSRISAYTPNLDNYASKIKLLNQRLLNLSEKYLIELKTKISSYRERIELLSPEVVIKRGYSVVKGSRGIVKSIKDIKLEEHLEIQVSDGKIFAKVESYE